MSRNFDLMQEMEREQAFHSSGPVETAFPIPVENPNRNAHRQLASDLTLRLVQQIFLQQTQEPPRMVVCAANRSWQRMQPDRRLDRRNTGEKRSRGSVPGGCEFSFPGAARAVRNNESPWPYRGPAEASVHRYHKVLYEADAAMKLYGYSLPAPLSADSPNLLSSERMRSRSAELRREFDFVIVDAPPLSRYADAIALGKLSDGIVLVLEAESTRREAARIAVENLRSFKDSRFSARSSTSGDFRFRRRSTTDSEPRLPLTRSRRLV